MQANICSRHSMRPITSVEGHSYIMWYRFLGGGENEGTLAASTALGRLFPTILG